MEPILASPFSQAFWRTYQLDATDLSHQVVFIYDFSNHHVDVARLNNALQALLSQLLLFHCHLSLQSGELVWVENVWSASHLEVYNHYSQEAIKAFSRKPLALDVGPLWRFAWFASGDKASFVAVLHHALIDGYSVDEFFGLLKVLYKDNAYQYQTSLAEQLKQLACSRKGLQKRIATLSEPAQFWQQYTEGVSQKIKMGLSFTRGDCFIQLACQEEHFFLESSLLNKVQALISDYELSLFAFFLLVWSITLANYTYSHCAFLTYPKAIKAGQALFFGAHVNLLPFAIDLTDSISFLGLVDMLKAHVRVVAANGYAYYPDALLKSKVDVGLQAGIAQTHLKSTNLELGDNVGVPNNIVSFDSGGTDLLLLLDTDVRVGKLSLCIKYNQRAFTQKQSLKIKQRFLTICNRLLDSPLMPIQSLLRVSSPFLKQQPGFGGVYSQPNLSGNLLSQFSVIVRDYPNKPAVRFQATDYSYSKIDADSTAFAYIISERLTLTAVPAPKACVAFMMDRGVEAVIVILAVMKLGLPYLPLEKNMPEKRLHYMLSKANTCLLVLDECSAARLTGLSYEQLMFSCDDIKAQTVPACFSYPVYAAEYAYGMYTSGTTGMPKLVLSPRMLCEARIFYMIAVSRIVETDRYLFKTNLSFDVSFSDMFSALLSGATLVMTAQAFNSVEITELLGSEAITAAHFVPSQFYQFKSFFMNHPIEKLFFSGEVLHAELLLDLDLSKTHVVNYYGPTELGECTAKVVGSTSGINIGKPFPFFECIVCDSGMNLMPQGAVGELCVHYPGIDETLPVSFTSVSSKSVPYYKTGDMVSWNEEGELLFFSRVDGQIKIDGRRINTASTSSFMATYPGIQEVHLLRLFQTKTLCAFFTASVFVDITALRQFLSAHLLLSMLPTYFFHLPTMPLTRNGKLDNKKLLAIACRAKAQYASPDEESHDTICHLFSYVSGCDKVGLDDDFFSLSVSSVDVLSLVTLIERYFGLQVSVQDVYVNSTPRLLAKCLFDEKKSLLIKLSARSLEDSMLLFHSSKGGIEVYRSLVKSSAMDTVGLAPYNLQPSATLCTSFSKLVSIYKKEVGGAYSEGLPRVFAGWSFGGLLAFEVAAGFDAGDDALPLLVLFDSFTPPYLTRVCDELGYNLLYTTVPDSNASNHLDKALRRFHMASRAHIAMACNASLHTYEGEVLLVKAGKGSSVIPHNTLARRLNLPDDYGWSQYASKLHVETIDATHEEMLTMPYVQQLNQLIENYLPQRVGIMSV